MSERLSDDELNLLEAICEKCVMVNFFEQGATDLGRKVKRDLHTAFQELRKRRAQDQHTTRDDLAQFQTEVHHWEALVKHYFEEGDEDE
jgi:hypothetical protein